jgi:hypothetical protein
MERKTAHFLAGLEGQGALQVRPSKSDDQALVTLGQKRIVEYNFVDRTVVTNFFLPSHMTLSTPLAFDSLCRRYVCVVNHTLLFVFDGTENHLENVAVTRTLDKPAEDILAFDGGTFVIFQDGDVQPLQHVVDSPIVGAQTSPKKTKTSPIRSSRLLWHKGQLYCVHIRRDSVALNRLTLDPTTYGYEQILERSFPCKGSVAVEVIGSNIAWSSSKKLTITSLFGDSSQKPSFEQHFDSTTGESCQAMATLSDRHLCISGPKRDAEDGDTIRVVDIEFGTTVATVALKSATNTELACYASTRILFKQGSRVACSIMDHLPCGLSDLVGRHNGTAQAEIDDGLLPWSKVEQKASACTDYERWHTIISGGNLDSLRDCMSSCPVDMPDILKITLIESLVCSTDDLDLIGRAFCLPITEAVALQHLRCTDHTTAKKMILSLLELLQRDALEGGQCDQLLTWLSILVDAHYTNFVVSKDADSQEMLIQCANMLADLDASVNMLATLMAQMKIIKTKNAINQAHYSNQMYSIEVVHL